MTQMQKYCLIDTHIIIPSKSAEIMQNQHGPCESNLRSGVCIHYPAYVCLLFTQIFVVIFAAVRVV